MYETIELERSGGAATIRLNRPEALNAWNAALGDELLHAVRAVASDDEVRAVCVTGAGRAFSSGGDLRDMASRPRTPDGHIDVYTSLTTTFHPILTGLRTMPKPVLAAVNGPAVGIGCSLALSCDLVVAAESAYLSLAFARIGLVPDGGASALVSARAGGGRALEMAMLGDRVPAATALRWGLVNEVLPDDELQARRRRAAAAPRDRADALLRGLQAPAQRLAVRRPGGAARARGARPAGDGRVRATSPRAWQRSSRSASSRPLTPRGRLEPDLQGRRVGLAGPGPTRPTPPRTGDRGLGEGHEAHDRRMNRMPPALAAAHSRTRRRVFTIAFAASLAGVLALTGVASADLWTPESGGSPNADDIDTLYKIVLAVAAVIFVGVEGALLYSLVKFRAQKDAVPAQIRGNTSLEVGWTLGAAVVLVVLAVVTFAMLPGIRTPPNSDCRRLRDRCRRERQERLGVPAAPAQRPRAEHQGQRPALRLALHVSRRQGRQRPRTRRSPPTSSSSCRPRRR